MLQVSISHLFYSIRGTKCVRLSFIKFKHVTLHGGSLRLQHTKHRRNSNRGGGGGGGGGSAHRLTQVHVGFGGGVRPYTAPHIQQAGRTRAEQQV